MAGGMQFPELIQKAETILNEALGGPVQMGAVDRLSDEQRRNLLLRCHLAGGPSGAPDSVILKAPDRKSYDPENGVLWSTRGFFADWAGLEFLNAAGGADTGCPHLYGGDRSLGFIVMEDLGSASDLAHVLMRGTAAEAEAGLVQLMVTVGKMHAATIGRAAEFQAIRRRLGPGAEETDHARALQDREERCQGTVQQAAQLGVVSGANLDRDIQQVCESQADPGPFFAYTHGDPCPDNCLLHEGRLRLFDFEIGAFRHALRDGVYGRVLFPTCWCVGAIPEPVVEKMDRAYRAELVKGCPEASEDDRYFRAVTETCAAWLLENLSWHLLHARHGDSAWGLASLRQRVMERLRRFSRLAERTGHLPALQKWAASLNGVLRARWLVEIEELRPYEAFRNPRRPDSAAAAEMIRAVEAGDCARVSALLTDDPALADIRLPDGVEAPVLSLALQKGQQEIAARLLLAGADPGVPDRELRPPLYYAIRYASPAAVLLLLDHGADLNRRDGQGDLALYTALERAGQGLPRPEGEQEFGPADRQEGEGMRDSLLACGARVDLLAAIVMGDEDRARTLLEEDPERAQSGAGRGETLLHRVAALGDRWLPFAELLLAHGAQRDQKSWVDKTPLEVAQSADQDGSHHGVIALLQQDEIQIGPGTLTS